MFLKTSRTRENPIDFLLRAISTSQCLKNQAPKTHYTVLGINPNATQAEIKAAYYKLSKIYHPDTNQGKGSEENLKKFRSVAAAYEVLGTVKSRKIYDMGLPIRSRFEAHEHEQSSRSQSSAAQQFYRVQRVRNKMSSPMYDFDAWSRFHYGDTFRKQQAYKRSQEVQRARRQTEEVEFSLERLLFIITVMIGSLLFLSPDYGRYDRVTTRSKAKDVVEQKNGDS